MRLIKVILTGLLCFSARYGACYEAIPEDPAPVKAKLLAVQVEELKEDISTINLLNGLRLTRQQSEVTLDLARQAKQARGYFTGSGPQNSLKARADFTKNGSQDILDLLEKTAAAFETFKAEDLKGEPPRGAISKNAASMERQIKDNNQITQLLQSVRAAPHQNKDNKTQQRLAELDGKLNRTLTDGQKEIVKTFKACLIPPADLRDPVRAGEAASAGAVKKLQEFRALSQENWNARKDALAAKEADPRGKLNENELAAEKSRILNLAEKARKLSDTDFELQKTDLAAQLKPDKKPAHSGELSWAAHWLLAPRVIPLLEARLAAAPQMADGKL